MNRETVFTNNETGKLLQKAWINENLQKISDAIDEHTDPVDFALVTPDGNKNAKVSLYNLKQFYGLKGTPKDVKQGIVQWVKNHKGSGFISVIFINKKGRVSLYNVPIDFMNMFGGNVLVA